MSNPKLSHVPGPRSFLGLKDTFQFFKNPMALLKRKQAQYGNIYRSSFLGNSQVNLLDPDATKFLLVDNAKIFHSKEAWEIVLKELFPNGLMLMDGEEHKYHRTIVAEAFKKEPMEGYLNLMQPLIHNFCQELDKSQVKLFPLFKGWTLTIALKVFFGLSQDKEFEKINEALIHVVKASTSFPIKLPFTTYGKGIRARKRLEDYFKKLVLERRKNPGNDLFSKLCQVSNEEGEKLSDQQVIDHLIFILMAAHDTTASTLTSLAYFLAKDPKWQRTCREEAIAFFESNDGEFKVRDLRELTQMGLAIKETLRIYPPLITVGRKSTEEVSYNGYDFPKGTHFNTVFQHNHLNENIWENPHNFEPDRFSKERKEHMKCPYAYSPFGAGIHHCLGFAFAEMQIKLIMSKLICDFQWTVPEDYSIPMKAVPIQEPEDGLPVEVQRL